MQILLNQFIKYKVHIGHKIINTNLLSSWFLYRIRNNIWIINLYKTLWILKLVNIFIKYLITSNKSIWFINMDLSKQYIINQYANECGEFACTAIWIRGLLSNYFSMLLTVKKYMSKSYIYKDYKLYNFYHKWYLTRYTWPRAIFISNLKNYNIICKEAISMFIPIIGIADTNIRNHYFNFPIPCNDDSYDSLTYICSIISKYVLLNKYKKIILWLNFYKYKKTYNNIISFLGRIKNIYKKLNKLIKRKYYIFNKLDVFLLLRSSINKMYGIYKRKNIYIKNVLIIDNIKRKLEFYYDLINIGWYKKYSIYKNRFKMIKLDKVYYILNFFKHKHKNQYWFYFLYYMSYLRYYRIIIEMFMSDDITDLFHIGSFNRNNYLKKYRSYKDKWFNRYLKNYLYLDNKDFYYSLYKDNIQGFVDKYNIFNKQIYLILFIKYINFNIINNI